MSTGYLIFYGIFKISRPTAQLDHLFTSYRGPSRFASNFQIVLWETLKGGIGDGFNDIFRFDFRQMNLPGTELGGEFFQNR
jgi:hypothetical protein